jgi:hypothetical protein
MVGSPVSVAANALKCFKIASANIAIARKLPDASAANRWNHAKLLKDW